MASPRSRLLTSCRFTGPKITLNLDDLSESQERALADEGLEVEHDPTAHATSGTQNVPLAREMSNTSKEVEGTRV